MTYHTPSLSPSVPFGADGQPCRRPGTLTGEALHTLPGSMLLCAELDGFGISAEAEMALGAEGLRGSDVLCRELASRVVMEAETREGGAGISRDGAVEVVMEVLRRLGVVQSPFVPLSDPNIEFEEPVVPLDGSPKRAVCARCGHRDAQIGSSWCHYCTMDHSMNTNATPHRPQDAGGSCGGARGMDAARPPLEARS